MVMMYQIGNLLKYLMPYLSPQFPYVEWIYPFSFPASLSGGYLMLLPMTLYLGLSVFLYRKSFGRYWAGTTHQVYARGRERAKIKPKISTPLGALFKKDWKLLTREPRLMYSLVVFPIIMIITSFTSSGNETTKALGLLVMSMIYGVMIGPFCSHFMLQIDAKYSALLYALPIKRRDRIYAKALIILIPFFAACVITGLINGCLTLTLLIAPAAMALITSLTSLGLILKFVPKTATFIEVGWKRWILLIGACGLLAGLVALLSVAFRSVAFRFLAPGAALGIASIVVLTLVFLWTWGL
jgi:predicted permease